MSIGSFFKALVPFASSAASSVDAEIKAIQDKATADIAAAKLKHTQAQASATLQTKRVNWAQFQKDYEALLASQSQQSVAPSSPSPAPTGSTGPAGP